MYIIKNKALFFWGGFSDPVCRGLVGGKTLQRVTSTLVAYTSPSHFLNLQTTPLTLEHPRFVFQRVTEYDT